MQMYPYLQQHLFSQCYVNTEKKDLSDKRTVLKLNIYFLMITPLASKPILISGSVIFAISSLDFPASSA